MSDLAVGDTVSAEIVRIEEYGLWCRYLDHEILVLIPDVRDRSMGPTVLKTLFSIADSVRIRILLYNDEAKKFRGTMIGV